MYSSYVRQRGGMVSREQKNCSGPPHFCLMLEKWTFFPCTTLIQISHNKYTTSPFVRWALTPGKKRKKNTRAKFTLRSPDGKDTGCASRFRSPLSASKWYLYHEKQDVKCGWDENLYSWIVLRYQALNYKHVSWNLLPSWLTSKVGWNGKLARRNKIHCEIYWLKPFPRCINIYIYIHYHKYTLTII